MKKPKYKRRRVSAIRDYPPGCGPAPRVILTAREEASCVCSVENSVGGDQSGGDDSGVDSARPSGSVVESEPLSVLQNSVPSKKLKRRKYRRRVVSAVRNFPGDVRRSRREERELALLEINSWSQEESDMEDKSDIEDRSDVEGKSLEETVKTDEKPMEDDVLNENPYLG